MSLWLMHYGVKGMDWGVRRYEDANGHLTELGKQRYAKYRMQSKDRRENKMAGNKGKNSIESKNDAYQERIDSYEERISSLEESLKDAKTNEQKAAIKKQISKLTDMIDELQAFIVRGEEFLNRGKE